MNAEVQEVQLIDMLEKCLLCINALAKTLDNRAIIRDPFIVQILKQVLRSLSYPSTPQSADFGKRVLRMMNITCNILNELAADHEGAFLISIEQTGGCQCIQVLIERFQREPSDSTGGKIGKIRHFLT